MSRCLRCGAGPEWLAGRVLDDVAGELDDLKDVTNDRDEWKTQHENLLAMYRTSTAEIFRITRELDEARKENERARIALDIPGPHLALAEALAQIAELEARLAWRKVSEPPADGVEVLTCHAESGVINACIRLPNKFESLETGDRMDKDVTHWREIGELPAAPHEAEPPRDKP